MTDIDEIINKLVDFRNQRDWKQFHNPKDLAAALSIEASELLECFLWKSSEEATKERVREELADVFSYAFLIAEHYDFDVKDIIMDKIIKNDQKYPVEKAKGKGDKYSEL
ncbi:MAG: nucleotide pyrophosphohydrolase [Saprospiraceae bacterium]|nr:nucleotide pyrophosphohydrolase [Saprospiraceae bacterium]